MTELHKLYNSNKAKFNAELQAMDTEQLFAELDDTIQFDILQADNVKWGSMTKEKAVYNAIVQLLSERMSQ